MQSVSDTQSTGNVDQSWKSDGKGGKAALVVRVKRRRSTSITSVPQQICVTQSSSGSRGLGSLSLTDGKSESSQPRLKRNRSVVLDLVSTIDSSIPTSSENASVDSTAAKDTNEHDIDSSTFIAIKQKRKRVEEVNSSYLPPSSTTGNASAAKPTQFIYYTSGKKTLTDDQDGRNLLVVDMSIHDGANAADASLAPNQVKTSCGNVATKILSPITRLVLEPAVHVYTQNLNFTPISDAISQGADINHQISSMNGMSALMVASQMGDPRAASKLISMGANVHATDMDGKNALDYAIEAKKNAGYPNTRLFPSLRGAKV